MKTLHIGAAFAAVIGLGLMIAGATAQQSTTPRNDAQNRFGQQATQGQQNVRQTQTARDQKSTVRASKIIGMEVKNNRDEDLGSIEDLVLDPTTGRVSYAAVSMGGFLGMGDKLFAVPWNAIECRPERGATGDDAEHVAILNVSKEQLQNAEGFDQDHWPDMANERWQQQNDRHFRSAQRGEFNRQER